MPMNQFIEEFCMVQRIEMMFFISMGSNRGLYVGLQLQINEITNLKYPFSSLFIYLFFSFDPRLITYVVVSTS
jgi:hypothetical protein